MTKGEAKGLETNVVNFPMEPAEENQAAVLIEETAAAKPAVEKASIKADIQIRFTRLKKSLRKRSASIL